MTPPECINLVFKNERIGSITFLSGIYFADNEPSENLLAFRKADNGTHMMYAGNYLSEKAMDNGESRIKLKVYKG